LRRTHDRVLGRELTEVDARLEVAESTIARDAGLDEHRQTVRLALVAVRGDDTEPVRVDDGVVVPPALRLASLVEFTESDDRVLHLPIDLVAVDIEVGGELVELPHLLELTERVGDER